jgi:Mor family transcriptional regulator
MPSYQEWAAQRAAEKNRIAPFQRRGMAVYRRHQLGEPAEKLADEYAVSVEAIRRLIRMVDRIAGQMRILEGPPR